MISEAIFFLHENKHWIFIDWLTEPATAKFDEKGGQEICFSRQIRFPIWERSLIIMLWKNTLGNRHHIPNRFYGINLTKRSIYL